MLTEKVKMAWYKMCFYLLWYMEMSTGCVRRHVKLNLMGYLRKAHDK